MTVYAKLTVIIIFLLAMATGAPAPETTGYHFEDIPVGSPTVKYVDPEFSSDNDLFTFRTAWLNNGEAWVGWLDPSDGTLVSETGQDIWVANKLSPLIELIDNGPEWIRDNSVYKVLYTGVAEDVPRMYLWSSQTGQSELVGNFADSIARAHYAGTYTPSGSGKILYQRQLVPNGPQEVFWLDLSAPNQEFHLPGVILEISLPTWISRDTILYTTAVSGTLQLAQYETLSHTETILTADDGDKMGPYAWAAPEFGGQIFYLAAVAASSDANPRSLRIYRHSERATLELYAELIAPPDAGNHLNFASPEPFIYQGRSYISLVLAPDDYSETSIWVFPLPDQSGGYIPQRVDDPDLHEVKLDPESYITRYGAYIYYYYSDNNRLVQTPLRRCLFLPSPPPH